jgi:hypothetical protein
MSSVWENRGPANYYFQRRIRAIATNPARAA